MDRYHELIDKRNREGLTDDEADELGRLMAERRGEPYEGHAKDPPPDVELRRASVPEEEIEDELARKRPVGPRGTEPNLTSEDPEEYPEGGQGMPVA